MRSWQLEIWKEMRDQHIRMFFSPRLLSIFMGVIGLSLGVLYSFGGALIDVLVTLGWIASSETPGLSYGTVLAFGAIIVMPSSLALLGFMAGSITGCLRKLIR
jgi:hypothetical protein